MQVKADPGADNIFQRYKDRKSFETKSTTWEVDPGKFTHMDSLNELRAFDRQLDTPKLDDPNTREGALRAHFRNHLAHAEKALNNAESYFSANGRSLAIREQMDVLRGAIDATRLKNRLERARTNGYW